MILALCSLFALLLAGMLTSTHLWWGEPFARWYDAEGRRMMHDAQASLTSGWARIHRHFGQGHVATARLERFAERQSMEIAPVNPFGDDNEVPRRSLRALARQSTGQAASRSGLRALEPHAAPEPAMPPAASLPLNRTFAVIESPEGADALARSARRGDIWLNLTRFEVWASVRSRRSTLIDELTLHPEWSDETLYALGMALGIWSSGGAFAANLSRNRRRVRRLRTAAESRADARAAA